MKKNFDVPEEKRKKLGDYIKKLRLEKEYGFNQFALKAQINVADLSRLEKGEKKKINAYQLMNIASAFKIDYKELYKIVGYLEEETEKNLEKSNISNKFEIDGAKIIEIPVFGSASAGGGQINLGNVVRMEKITVLAGEDLPKDTFAVDVAGDSMLPTIMEGDLILVDPRCNDVDLKNEICVVTYEGAEYVKRITFNEKFITLMSDNQDKETYPPIMVLRDENTDFKCHGVVIEVRRRLKRRR